MASVSRASAFLNAGPSASPELASPALHGQSIAANRAPFRSCPHRDGAGKHLSEGRNPAMSLSPTSSLLPLLAASADAGGGPPAWMQFLPLVAMGVIFWFLILRPQMRQQKQHRAKIAAIKKGDQVLTGGGFVGKVLKVDDDYAELELGPNVKVKALKSTIADILSPTGSKPAND
jgi:preprotein translocase subunit YajC